MNLYHNNWLLGNHLIRNVVAKPFPEVLTRLIHLLVDTYRNGYFLSIPALESDPLLFAYLIAASSVLEQHLQPHSSSQDLR